jgi:hypothetical protein
MPNGSEKLDKKIGKLAAMMAEKGRTEDEVRRQSCLLEARYGFKTHDFRP